MACFRQEVLWLGSRATRTLSDKKFCDKNFVRQEVLRQELCRRCWLVPYIRVFFAVKAFWRVPRIYSLTAHSSRYDRRNHKAWQQQHSFLRTPAMVMLLTAADIQQWGLGLAGFGANRQVRVGQHTKEERFIAHFGALPIVCAELWRDLQITTVQAARIAPNNINDFPPFLMTLHFLKCYPTECVLAGGFQICEKSVRKWIRFYVDKISALRNEKIVWPDNINQTHFIMSVDGTHCPILEKKHPTLAKDPQYFSHKLNRAALAYEIGIALFESRILWINGPFPAGHSDYKIFCEGGLQDVIPHGKKVIADKGYRGNDDIISTPNPHDDAVLRKFKSRARARHETINGLLKSYMALQNLFRHTIELHGQVFEAICVICQYRMDNGAMLFDI